MTGPRAKPLAEAREDRVPERSIGFRNGVRFSVQWLHARANEMNDPNAKAILDSAAFNLGTEPNALSASITK